MEAQTRVQLHVGKILVNVIGQVYPHVKDGILEYYQNSIDASARRVVLSLDKRNRDFKVWDDGHGLSRKKMGEILSQVGHSLKSERDYGRHGIGLFSLLGKCQEFEIVSCAAGSREYWRWTFNTDEIK